MLEQTLHRLLMAAQTADERFGEDFVELHRVHCPLVLSGELKRMQGRIVVAFDAVDVLVRFTCELGRRSTDHFHLHSERLWRFLAVSGWFNLVGSFSKFRFHQKPRSQLRLDQTRELFFVLVPRMFWFGGATGRVRQISAFSIFSLSIETVYC